MRSNKYKKVKIEQKVPFFQRKESWIFILLLVVGLVTILGSSYAVFTMLVTGDKKHSVMAGTFRVDFEENNDTIQLLNTYPMSDSEGLSQDGYTFTITNNGTVDALYRVRLVEDVNNTLGLESLKFAYEKDSVRMGDAILLSSIGSVIETNQSLAPGESVSYTLKLWLKEEAGNEVQGLTYKAKLVVDGVQQIDGEFDDVIGPEITINGEKYPTVTVGSTYDEPGVLNITDNIDGVLSVSPTISYEYFDGVNTTVVNRVDTSKVGVYYTYYRASDLNGNMGVAVRVVHVVDEISSKPTITLVGSDVVNLTTVSKYEEQGVITQDGDGNDLSDKVITVGSVNTNVSGTYIIKYYVVDRSNHISSVVRQVKVKNPNSNILAVYQYSSSSCITGEESTCVSIGPQAVYSSGTIIKYKVNSSTEKYFHVMFDNTSDGTLTMQQRENTVGITKWYDGADDNSKGPLTVLPVLENATSGWTNVNDQEYALGSTIFKENAFTGCSYTTCTKNTYSLPKRTAKARMITVQETNALGCTNVTQSCPVWMNNYLLETTNYGGTINGTDRGYWTLSAAGTTGALYVYCNGSIYSSLTTGSYAGARAVVVIDK